MIVTDEQRKEAHAFYREALELLEESGPVIDQTQYSTDIKEWNYKVSTIKTT